MIHLLQRRRLLDRVGLLILGFTLFSQDLEGQQYTRYSAPEMFSYQELLVNVQFVPEEF